MKTLKNFTDGLAILLAVLILIYMLTLYAKFKPDEKKVEAGESKIVLFIESAQTNRDCLRMVFVLLVSAAAGFLLRRRPETGIVFSCFALCFVLLLFANHQIPKRPMVVVSLTLCHAAGALVYAADSDRKTGGASCPNGGLLCGAGMLTLSGVVLHYQTLARRTADILASLSDNGVSLPDNVRFIPGLADLIRRRYESEGRLAAEDLAIDFSSGLRYGTMKTRFLESVDAEQFSVYLKLSILIFAAAVLCFALRRKSRLLCALISAVPVCFCAVELQKDRLSSMALPLIVLALWFAATHFIFFETDGTPDAETSEELANAVEEAERTAPSGAGADAGADTSSCEDAAAEKDPAADPVPAAGSPASAGEEEINYY
jgi:hypothetical protein